MGSQAIRQEGWQRRRRGAGAALGWWHVWGRSYRIPPLTIKPTTVEAVDSHKGVVYGLAAIELGEEQSELISAKAVYEELDDAPSLAIENDDVLRRAWWSVQEQNRLKSIGGDGELKGQIVRIAWVDVSVLC